MTEAVLLGAATIVRLVGALHATLLGYARTVAALSMAMRIWKGTPQLLG
jgi:hypothetical protein